MARCAPGNSIGTINVQGNLVFTAASTYLVEIDPNTSDRTNVTGTATLGGATVSAIYATGSYVCKTLHHPQCRRRRQRHVQHAGQHQPAGELHVVAELRCRTTPILT